MPILTVAIEVAALVVRWHNGRKRNCRSGLRASEACSAGRPNTCPFGASLGPRIRSRHAVVVRSFAPAERSRRRNVAGSVEPFMVAGERLGDSVRNLDCVHASRSGEDQQSYHRLGS